MKNNKQIFSINGLSGIGTWAMILGLSLYLLPNTSAAVQANYWLIVSCFVAYIVSFILLIRKEHVSDNRSIQLFILTAQLAFAYLTMWYLPFSFLPILTIIWAAILPHFFSLGISILITVGVVIISSAIFGFHWDDKHYMFQGALYFTFHLFAILMMRNAKAADDANKLAQRLNQELQATQHLLSEASRQNERTRIARDLHDLLGHHLTALIINLQVAERLSEGDAKNKIEQCHSLSKLLLSDVREAVRSLRENHELDFIKMVDLMIENIPNLKVTTSIDTQLDLEDLDMAKALLSCIQEAITNSLRHSGASQFWITMKLVKSNLELELLDNGQIHGKLTQGNGLTGMQERIQELNGYLSLDRIQNSLRIRIDIPFSRELSKTKL